MKKGILYICVLMAFFACEAKKQTPAGAQTTTETTTSTPVQSVEPERGRYAWQKPHLVINKLGDLTDKVVADIGAGTGYFTFRIAPRAKKVIAVDIDPDMIQLLEVFKQNLDSLQQTKIEIRTASEDNPHLNKDEVDVAIIINTIGYIEDREAYMKNLFESLHADGELLIVDFKMKRIPDNIAPDPEYRVSLLELEELLARSGYRQISVDDRSLEYQYIVKAKK